MEKELLKYIVQKIDGSKESILNAMRAILESLDKNDGEISKSIEHTFFEECIKSVFDWISKGTTEFMQEIILELNNILATHEELTYPMAGLNGRKRIGIQMNFLAELMNIYQRSDLEFKDIQRIMLADKVQNRRRNLLIFLYKKASPFKWQDIKDSGLYDSGKKPDALKKSIERDLNELVKYNFLKENLFGRKNLYELTPRAYYYKNRIVEMQMEETKPVENIIPDAFIRPTYLPHLQSASLLAIKQKDFRPPTDDSKLNVVSHKLYTKMQVLLPCQEIKHGNIDEFPNLEWVYKSNHQSESETESEFTRVRLSDNFKSLCEKKF